MALASASAAPLVLLAEVDAFRAGSATAGEELGWAAAPILALTRVAVATESSATILASDMGYRTREADTVGLRLYPPILDAALDTDTRVVLSPLRTAIGASWGTLRLLSPDGALQTLASASTCDGRGVRVYAARRDWDSNRKLWIDPPWADFAPALIGIAGGGWTLADTTLDVPLRDGSYYFERALASNTYQGTGGIEGGADLKGKVKPRLRGGTSAAPVLNIPAQIVDTTNLIYQISDAAFTVSALYEGGDTNGITAAASTSNLLSGTCPAGQYRLGTGAHAGLFQLGSRPSRVITVDAHTGFFPSFGTPPTTLALLTYRVLVEDLGVPAELLDSTHWTALSAACSYGGGFWLGTEAVRGDDLVGMLLTGLNAKMVPTRAGTLRPVLLRALAQQTPAASWGTGEIVSVKPMSLEAPLDPPPLQWKVGYQRNYLVMTTDIDPDVTAARRATLAEEWRIAPSTINAAVAGQFRRPSDPGTIETALTSATDAAALATVLDALWSTQRRSLYAVEVPAHLAYGRSIGDVVSLTWPFGLLAGGVLAQIVGESFRGNDATATLYCLAASSATLLAG